MARRRRVDVPSAEALAEVEAGFEVKSAFARPAPIAQIAAESAALSQPLSAEDRVQAALETTDAEKYRAAEAEGRIAIDLPISEIIIDELTRDRAVIDGDAMAELKSSIAEHGLRVPIDVFVSEQGGYALVSGFRRLLAIRELQGPKATIKAIIRKPADLSEAYVAMVEENEIRADLCHYERGRIAVLAVGQRAFKDVGQAVNTLFAAGSKAKRSKIRSFAMIHEELGDVLNFPTALGERIGLRIAGALKAGQGEDIRRALADADTSNVEQEDRVLSMTVDRLEGKGAPKVSRAKPVDRERGKAIQLTPNVSMRRERDKQGYLIRLEGDGADEAFVESVMKAMRDKIGT